MLDTLCCCVTCWDTGQWQVDPSVHTVAIGLQLFANSGDAVSHMLQLSITHWHLLLCVAAITTYMVAQVHMLASKTLLLATSARACAWRTRCTQYCI